MQRSSVDFPAYANNVTISGGLISCRNAWAPSPLQYPDPWIPVYLSQPAYTEVLEFHIDGLSGEQWKKCYSRTLNSILRILPCSQSHCMCPDSSAVQFPRLWEQSDMLTAAIWTDKANSLAWHHCPWYVLQQHPFQCIKCASRVIWRNPEYRFTVQGIAVTGNLYKYKDRYYESNLNQRSECTVQRQLRSEFCEGL